MANLAPNLIIRRNPFLVAPYNLEVGWIGNAAHQEECSDHNPDATGRVHAIDVMTLNIALQKQIVQWCLCDPDDLEYFINQRTIWTRHNDFKPAKYTGVDPHTNHVHISGRHGLAHADAATCTGYDLAAESYVPGRFPLSLNAADLKAIQAIVDASVPKIANATWLEPIQNNVTNKKVPAEVFITSINSQVNDIHNAIPVTSPPPSGQ